MESYLAKFRGVEPGDDFRERVLARARAREEEGWCERQWRSGWFWATAAAAALALFVINRAEPTPGKGPAPRVEEAPSGFVKQLADMMGDGAPLERRLRMQLSGDGAEGGGEGETPAMLRRDLPWRS